MIFAYQSGASTLELFSMNGAATTAETVVESFPHKKAAEYFFM